MEVSVSYLILSLALVALVPVFIMAIRAAKNNEQIAAATWLSTELMEEVRMRRWDENTPTPAVHIAAPGAIGTDTGETASDKRTFDDQDDFNGWTQSPPVDPVMNAISGFAAYSSSVTVQYADANLAFSAAATDYKKVSVCTWTRKLKSICLTTVFTNR